MNRAKNDLKSALQKEGVLPESNRQLPVPEPVDPVPVAHAHRRRSRQGKKIVSGHFEKAVHRQLKVICLETDSTIQELLADSLNLLFEHHGKDPIA